MLSAGRMEAPPAESMRRAGSGIAAPRPVTFIPPTTNATSASEIVLIAALMATPAGELARAAAGGRRSEAIPDSTAICASSDRVRVTRLWASAQDVLPGHP